MLAVVGRPNVGKSTLVNRILGRREAVVEDVPGVTRDRVSYDATWAGRAFTVVDTGGWDPDARGLAERIKAQAEIAVGLADAVLFVVDATVGITDADESVVRVLRAVQEAGDPGRQQGRRPARRGRGLRAVEPRPGRALPGLGPARPRLGRPARRHPRGAARAARAVLRARRPARAGSPSSASPTSASRRCSTGWPAPSGSSSTPSPAPPSTRSTSWSTLGGREWRFIDTAGIRKRVKEASGHEFYASLRTSTAIDRAEVAVLVLDADQSISEQDVRILQTVREAGRALVIAFNKWDLVDEERRHYLEREVERELVQVQWAPRINITARTGWHVDRLVRRSTRRWRAGRPGSRPGRSTRSSAGSSPSTRTRCAAASSRRSCSAPSRRSRRRRSCCSRPAKLDAGLRALHRAPPARGLRLRRYADRAHPAGPRETQALTRPA